MCRHVLNYLGHVLGLYVGLILLMLPWPNPSYIRVGGASCKRLFFDHFYKIVSLEQVAPPSSS